MRETVKEILISFTICMRNLFFYLRCRALPFISRILPLNGTKLKIKKQLSFMFYLYCSLQFCLTTYILKLHK